MSTTTQLDQLNVVLKTVNSTTQLDGMNITLAADTPPRYALVSVTVDGDDLIVDFSDTQEPVDGYNCRIYSDQALTNQIGSRTVEGSLVKFSIAGTGVVSGNQYWVSIQSGGAEVIDPVPGEIGEGSQALDTQWANDFYTATGGANWTNNSGWNGGDVTLVVGDYYEAGTPYGLRCADISGEVRITGVDMWVNGLSNGTQIGSQGGEELYELVTPIPDVIPLKKLEFWDTRGNILGGNEFPDGFRQSTTLKRFYLCGRTNQSERDIKVDMFQDAGKSALDGSFWTCELPQDWSACQSLEAIEISQMRRPYGMTGQIPSSLVNLPNIFAIITNGNSHTGQLPEITNPSSSNLNRFDYSVDYDFPLSLRLDTTIPVSWGNLPEFRWIRLQYHNISGTFPDSWGNLSGVRVLSFTSNLSVQTKMSGEFPAHLFTHGRNTTMAYFDIKGHNFYGVIPQNIPLATFSVLGLAENNFEGKVPNWLAQIGHVQFGINNNNFSSLGSDFYNPDAPIYRQIRLFYLNNNNFLNVELPDVLFSRIDYAGGIVSQNVLEIGVDINLGVVFTGEVTQTTSTGGDWFRDEEAAQGGLRPWPHNWISYEITLIDPDGIEPNRRFINISATNWDLGYFYPRGQDDLNTGQELDIGGITGWTYKIRPVATGKVIRFKRGENDYIPRRIVSNTDSTVTLEREIDESIVGMHFDIHGNSPNFLEIMTYGNDWIGKLPESYAYIPTPRTLSWMQMGRGLLEGVVPDFTNLGAVLGGDANRVYIQDQKFLPRDLLPNITANNTLSVFDYSNQKPFSSFNDVIVTIGSDLFLDDFVPLFEGTGYTFSWRKDGVEVQTTVELGLFDIQQSDLGVYNLIVTHTDLTGQWDSGNILIQTEE